MAVLTAMLSNVQNINFNELDHNLTEKDLSVFSSIPIDSIHVSSLGVEFNFMKYFVN